MSTEGLSTQRVCRLLHVCRETIFLWERQGRIKNVQRDSRGWRVYSPENIKQIERIISGSLEKNDYSLSIKTRKVRKK